MPRSISPVARCFAPSRWPSVVCTSGQPSLAGLSLLDRLVASGHIESRRGSGFYVAAATTAETACDRTGVLDRAVDVANLIAELYTDEARKAYRANRLLAGGCLPTEWQEESGIRRHARHVASDGAQLTDFGNKLGFPPLREVIARLEARALVGQVGFEHSAYRLGRARPPFRLLTGRVAAEAHHGMEFTGGPTRLHQRQRRG